MATHYVDSSASGANDGTSKTDAWTSIASATGVAAGDTVLVSHTHSQSIAATTGLKFSNSTATSPVRLLSTNFSTDALATGAVIQTTAAAYHLSVGGCLFCSGITFGAGYQLKIGQDPVTENDVMQFEGCTLKTVHNQTYNVIQIGKSLDHLVARFDNCTIDQLATTGGWNSVKVYSDDLRFHNLSFSLPGTVTNALFEASQSYDELQVILVEGSDLSGFSKLFKTKTGINGLVRVARCQLKSGYTAVDGSYPSGLRVHLEACAVGTITAPALGVSHFGGIRGTIESSLSQYRTGGADDGEQANAYSWEMAANANAAEVYLPLESPPLTRWVDSGSQTLTVYVASGATLNDDDFWVEVSSPSEAGSATAQANWQTTRADPLATPAALTTDSGSTWNGTGVGTKQQIDVSLNPTIAGPVVVRCYLAKPSTTVYVDPKLGVA